MPLDGLTINVLVRELDTLLKNGRVLKIYQPEEGTVTLQLRLPGKTEILLLSADPVYPRLHTVAEQPANPLNPPAFCMLLRKYLEPSRLMKIEQQGFDRLIHLYFEALDELGKPTELQLIFELMGRHSNLYLVNQEGIILDALRRFPATGVAPGQPYRAPNDQGKQNPDQLTPELFLDELRLLPAGTVIWKWLSQFLQGFSAAAAKEAVLRAGLSTSATRADLTPADGEKLQQAVQSMLEEIAAGGNPSFYPKLEDFAAYRFTTHTGELFPNINTLVEAVLGRRQEQKALESYQASLRRQLKSHLKRLAKKEAIHRLDLEQVEKVDELRQQGELLTASFHLIPKGASSVQVPDYTQEGAPLVTIELDPRLSPSANVQAIFKRYSKVKASYTHKQSQLELTLAEKSYLENTLCQIELADSLEILKEIEGELQRTGYLKGPAKAKTAKTSLPQGPERYVSSDGLTILVGRNNRQNDELTFRLTKPNHLWLHARGIPGSHVAVLSEGEIPESTLLEAAGLAAYFSAHRQAPKVAVDYTLRKYVRKPRGAKPGFVTYDQGKTIVVNPTKFKLPAKQR